MSLITEQNITDPDYFYEMLVDLQSGLEHDSVIAAYSKAILLLSNHIGDVDVLKQAFDIAKQETTRSS